VILSDKTIREELKAGRIAIEPFDDANVQPSSVDMHVDRYFRVFRNDTTPYIDPKEAQEDLTELVEVADGRSFILHPAEFALASTLERVRLPDDLAARLDGKSSLGRLGLQVHSTAGLADPCFTGQITLELSNMTRLPISLYPGMRVAQLVFEMLSTPADRPYGHGGLGSKYQGQSGPTPSQYWRNFEENQPRG
jgi:dCTP deaminase